MPPRRKFIRGNKDKDFLILTDEACSVKLFSISNTRQEHDVNLTIELFTEIEAHPRKEIQCIDYSPITHILAFARIKSEKLYLFLEKSTKPFSVLHFKQHILFFAMNAELLIVITPPALHVYLLANLQLLHTTLLPFQSIENDLNLYQFNPQSNRLVVPLNHTQNSYAIIDIPKMMNFGSNFSMDARFPFGLPSLVSHLDCSPLSISVTTFVNKLPFILIALSPMGTNLCAVDEEGINSSFFNLDSVVDCKENKISSEELAKCMDYLAPPDSNALPKQDLYPLFNRHLSLGSIRGPAPPSCSSPSSEFSLSRPTSSARSFSFSHSPQKFDPSSQFSAYQPLNLSAASNLPQFSSPLSPAEPRSPPSESAYTSFAAASAVFFSDKAASTFQPLSSSPSSSASSSSSSSFSFSSSPSPSASFVLSEAPQIASSSTTPSSSLPSPTSHPSPFKKLASHWTYPLPPSFNLSQLPAIPLHSTPHCASISHTIMKVIKKRTRTFLSILLSANNEYHIGVTQDTLHIRQFVPQVHQKGKVGEKEKDVSKAVDIVSDDVKGGEGDGIIASNATYSKYPISLKQSLTPPASLFIMSDEQTLLILDGDYVLHVLDLQSKSFQNSMQLPHTSVDGKVG